MLLRTILVSIVAILVIGASFTAINFSGQKINAQNPTDRISVSELVPISRTSEKFAVSVPLSSLKPEKEPTQTIFSQSKIQETSAQNVIRRNLPNGFETSANSSENFSGLPMPVPSLAFDGIKNRDNFDIYNIAFIPSSTTGDVGKDHYVQAVNSLLRVYDKETGDAMSPLLRFSQIFAPLNTPCSTRNDGQPVVLYDALADRWLISQYCNFAPPFRQMIAVSTTGNPLGTYNLYEFVMPNNRLNDYTKFGVWRDAFYMTSEEFVGNDFTGTGVFAFDREKILRGDSTANYVYFKINSPTTTRLGSFLPADLDGLTPPPNNAPGLFMSYSATEYGDAADALRLFEFRPNFGRPDLSTFTERAESPLAVQSFDPTSPPDRNDILQPAPGEALDSQSDRLMYRLSYRKFNSFESLVVNQTVRVSASNEPYRAGVRVYELRRNGANSPFSVQNQGTISQADDLSRWMGSAAQDKDGNLAVGYSTSSSIKNPSIIYSGRLAGDAPNTFRDEETIINGTGVQTAFGFRWGDYTTMSVDDFDGCSFYYTNQYYTAASQTESPFAWLTRIGKFRFPTCQNHQSGTISARVLNSQTGQPIANAILRTDEGYTRQSDANGVFPTMTVPPNSFYNVTVTANGFRPQSIPTQVAPGANVVLDFFLLPTAIMSPQPPQITAESCTTNNALEPGETVTINLPVKNTGAIVATNVVVTLQPNTSILNPSAAQNYGIININETVTRSFTFTVAPSVPCGDIIPLGFGFQFNSGMSAANAFVGLFQQVGTPKIAFREQFTNSTPPNFPTGWTTSASGAQEIWRTRLIEPPAGNLLAFSPESIQVGVNELVSPIVRLNTSTAKLRFNNKYELESTFLKNRLYDGGVLEIKIGNGEFQDILAAGGTFETGAYDGAIDACCQNPLAGRLGWSGKSGIGETAEVIDTKVNLPVAAAGQDVRMRWRVGTDVGGTRDGQYIDNIEITDGFECSCAIAPRPAPFDFDGDGKTDLSVFRPSNGVWFVQQSLSNSTIARNWGISTDKITPADFDGDGKTDLAVFRPSNATWFVLNSANNSVSIQQFGLSADVPTPNDFDGDRKADFGVFRNGTWFYLRSTDGGFRAIQFGINTDLPVSADFDGDFKADLAVFRPSNGTWYVLRSFDNNVTVFNFGTNGDRPIQADFDGDFRADFAVFRPSNRTWYIWKSATASVSVFEFGLSSDIPLIGDFDGDAKADISVFRAGTWFILRSTNGAVTIQNFGLTGDIPAPSAFIR